MTTAADFLRLFESRRLPAILQTEAAECGLACLAMVAGYYGLDIDLPIMRRRYAVSLKGMSLRNMMEIADALGFSARAVRVELSHLEKLATPAILHWRLNHFVVLKGRAGKQWVIHDPSEGIRTVGDNELSAAFSGVALELSPAIRFRPAQLSEKLKLSQLWSRITGLGKSIGQAAVLTIVLQCWVIVSPFFMQIVVDDVLPRHDMDLLAVLAVGFALFALVNAVSSAIRQMLFLSVGSLIGFQMASNVARHLLKLPISYFERRHAGDIISRFGGIQPIQSALTSGVVTAVVDGLMAIVTLILMLAYSPWLSLIAVVTFVLLVAMRAASFQAMKTRNDSAIVAQARHDSYVIESVRGIATLRLFNAESRRHAVWQNRLADIANARLGYGRFQVLYGLGNEALIGIETVLSIYVAVRLAFAGGFSVGMLYAYMSYKGQFLSKAVSLVDRWIEFRMLDLYLKRLADIALSNPDMAFAQLGSSEKEQPIRGAISLRGIAYRYGPGEPWVLRGANVDIREGEHVAIVGASGGGKTTLLKIMLGILRPESGRVAIDGESLDQFGYQAYRNQIAAVMQEDQLFAGSLADNIALFDPHADMARVRECAKIAAIHDEIMLMPMRYESLVGDMGTALSGGQKQRVLLARALYRRPRVLFLDEGTAHLDPKMEAAVSNAVSELGITRVIVAHRAETIRHAQRVLLLANGTISELSLAKEPAPSPLVQLAGE